MEIALSHQPWKRSIWPPRRRSQQLLGRPQRRILPLLRLCPQRRCQAAITIHLEALVEQSFPRWRKLYRMNLYLFLYYILVGRRFNKTNKVRRVDRRTNALPNQPTDTASYRGALSHLKKALINNQLFQSKPWIHEILQISATDKLVDIDPWNFDTKNVKQYTEGKKKEKYRVMTMRGTPSI